MTPVLQTHFGGPESNPVGNCMQAAVASLMNLPLDDVPHFVQGTTGHSESMSRLTGWLATHGQAIAETTADAPGWLLAKGPTRSGVHHWVIYRNGRLAHDPALGDGLLYAERFYELTAAREPEPVREVRDPADVVASHLNEESA